MQLKKAGSLMKNFYFF